MSQIFDFKTEITIIFDCFDYKEFIFVNLIYKFPRALSKLKMVDLTYFIFYSIFILIYFLFFYF